MHLSWFRTVAVLAGTACLGPVARPQGTVMASVAAQQHPSAAYRQAIDDIVNKQAYTGQQPAGSQWLDGSTRYTAL